jgi:hypothetical protein
VDSSWITALISASSGLIAVVVGAILGHRLVQRQDRQRFEREALSRRQEGEAETARRLLAICRQAAHYAGHEAWWRDVEGVPAAISRRVDSVAAEERSQIAMIEVLAQEFRDRTIRESIVRFAALLRHIDSFAVLATRPSPPEDWVRRLEEATDDITELLGAIIRQEWPHERVAELLRAKMYEGRLANFLADVIADLRVLEEARSLGSPQGVAVEGRKARELEDPKGQYS